MVAMVPKCLRHIMFPAALQTVALLVCSASLKSTKNSSFQKKKRGATQSICLDVRDG